MSGQDLVVQRMEKIRLVFQHALHIAEERDVLTIIKRLEETDNEFRVVAYEGAAMGLALKDLHEGTLSKWSSLVRNSNPNFVSHVHVGLGWAIAKKKPASLLFLESLDPFMVFRVLDGYGYCDGTFRQVPTIQNKERPGHVETKYLQAYDQGVGRSLWYMSKGDPQKVVSMIESFPELRQPALWRGVGIACSFVGGNTESALSALLDFSAKNREHLAVGVAIASRARMQTNTLNEDVELSCRILCNLSADEVIQLTGDMEPSSDPNPYNEYTDWLFHVESKLRAVVTPIRV